MIPNDKKAPLDLYVAFGWSNLRESAPDRIAACSLPTWVRKCCASTGRVAMVGPTLWSTAVDTPTRSIGHRYQSVESAEDQQADDCQNQLPVHQFTGKDKHQHERKAKRCGASAR